MFRAMGIAWGMPELERHYSPNWHHVYRAAKLPRAVWEKADRLWHKAYEKESPALLPGARNVIRRLARRFTLGIAHFSVCVCAEDAGRRKPHPAPLNLALRRLKLSPEECVYVGDSPEDIEMARRARVRAIGVRGPFPTAARVLAARPDLMLDSIAELPDWIEELR